MDTAKVTSRRISEVSMWVTGRHGQLTLDLMQMLGEYAFFGDYQLQLAKVLACTRSSVQVKLSNTRPGSAQLLRILE